MARAQQRGPQTALRRVFGTGSLISFGALFAFSLVNLAVPKLDAAQGLSRAAIRRILQSLPPTHNYTMLFALVLVSSVLAGVSLGRHPSRGWAHMLAYAPTKAITIAIILDMEYPRIGMITLDRFESDAFALGLPQ